jgi:glutathione synthase/RimK-type ligase-like ATP-grasp enzyme
MTILFITRKDDVHADMVARHLINRKINFFRLNTECSTEYSFKLNLNNGSIVNQVTGLTLNLTEVKSVYLRRRSVPENLPLSENDKKFAEREWTKFTRNIWVCLRNCKWMNNPKSIEMAQDKLLQLQVAKSIGFSVPDTLMTNSMQEVKIFSNKRKIIYKAFDGGSLYPGSDKSIYSTILTDDLLNKIPESYLQVCPGFFQEYIEKSYELRVTIVGDKIFAAKIDSQSSIQTKIDWRQSGNEFVNHDIISLTNEEEFKCKAILKYYGLNYGAIDLIRMPNNELYFLEVNSNGQWAWIEILTGAKISYAIASELSC